MSSIFSDPFFRRGTTLLSGEAIDLTVGGLPLAGGEVVGQVKCFQDVRPTGMGERFSNRLVYCIAARYKGSTVSDASTIAGTTFLFDLAAPLTQVTAQLTTATHIQSAAVGVIDEYLSGEVRTNDIVWVVVKGPTSVKRTAAVIGVGVAVQASTTAGSVLAWTTGIALGQNIEGAATSAAVGLTRVNLTSDLI